MAEEYYENNEVNEEVLNSEELIEKELADIYREMKKYSKTSEEYMLLSQRATDITEQRRNILQANEIKRQRYLPIIQTICGAAGNAVGSAVGQLLNRRTVNDVLVYERDGHIITSKAGGFIQKPRN